MSSPKEENPDLKGGHPPAVKAGGMRITQHKTAHPEKASPPKEPKAETEPEAEGETLETVEQPAPRQQLIISGVPARGDEDFPSSAVKAFHEKPLPVHEYRPAANKPNIIHQPRK